MGKGFSFNVLAVGSFKAQKDFLLLLSAFSQLPQSMNSKLVILGKGDLRPKLEALIQELGLMDRVTLPGFALEPSSWYRSADLFVL